MITSNVICQQARQQNLTDPEALEQLISCIEACGARYNYTIGAHRELIMQPYEIRPYNSSRGSPGTRLAYCTDHVGSRFFIITASNTIDEDDLHDSKELNMNEYLYLSEHMPLLQRELHESAQARFNHSISVRNDLVKRTGVYDAHVSEDQAYKSTDLKTCETSQCVTQASAYKSIKMYNGSGYYILMVWIYTRHDSTT
ncbi:hypothetical protein V1509DRAFT_373957 [Lipomyces kononenkoae]